MQRLAGAGQRAALRRLAQSLGAGNGGVNRGPGAAPLTYGRTAPDGSDAFAPQRLSPAQLRDLEHSRLVGVGSTAPTFDPQGQAADGSAFGTGGEQSVERRRLAPKHRRTVQEFFGTDSER